MGRTKAPTWRLRSHYPIQPDCADRCDHFHSLDLINSPQRRIRILISRTEASPNLRSVVTLLGSKTNDRSILAERRIRYATWMLGNECGFKTRYNMLHFTPM